MADYELLEKFAAGDSQVLQSVVDDSRVFINLLSEAVKRKKDTANKQFSIDTDPEKYYFSGDLDMLLA